jgi:hypothetical protein
LAEFGGEVPIELGPGGITVDVDGNVAGAEFALGVTANGKEKRDSSRKERAMAGRSSLRGPTRRAGATGKKKSARSARNDND